MSEWTPFKSLHFYLHLTLFWKMTCPFVKTLQSILNMAPIEQYIGRQIVPFELSDPCLLLRAKYGTDWRRDTTNFDLELSCVNFLPNPTCRLLCICRISSRCKASLTAGWICPSKGSHWLLSTTYRRSDFYSRQHTTQRWSMPRQAAAIGQDGKTGMHKSFFGWMFFCMLQGQSSRIPWHHLNCLASVWSTVCLPICQIVWLRKWVLDWQNSMANQCS